MTIPDELQGDEDVFVSPATGRPLTKRGEATRRRLLEGAETVFAEQGYHEASIVKITERAGIGLGTFYLYFDGKQQVFVPIYRQSGSSSLAVADGVRAALPGMVESEIPEGTKLEYVIDQSAYVRNAIESLVHEGVTAGGVDHHHPALAEAGLLDAARQRDLPELVGRPAHHDRRHRTVSSRSLSSAGLSIPSATATSAGAGRTVRTTIGAMMASATTT